MLGEIDFQFFVFIAIIIILRVEIGLNLYSRDKSISRKIKNILNKLEQKGIDTKTILEDSE